MPEAVTASRLRGANSFREEKTLPVSPGSSRLANICHHTCVRAAQPGSQEDESVIITLGLPGICRKVVPRKRKAVLSFLKGKPILFIKRDTGGQAGTGWSSRNGALFPLLPLQISLDLVWIHQTQHRNILRDLYPPTLPASPHGPGEELQRASIHGKPALGAWKTTRGATAAVEPGGRRLVFLPPAHSRGCREGKGCSSEGQLRVLLSQCHGAAVAAGTSPAAQGGSRSSSRSLGMAGYTSARAKQWDSRGMAPQLNP